MALLPCGNRRIAARGVAWRRRRGARRGIAPSGGAFAEKDGVGRRLMEIGRGRAPEAEDMQVYQVN